MKLQVKGSLFLSTLLLMTLLIMGIVSFYFLDSSLRQKANEDLQENTSKVKNRLDGFILNIQNDILNIAQHLDRGALQQKRLGTIEDFLRTAFLSNSRFDNGFFVLEAQGTLVVDYPATENRGKNFAFREYFKRTQEERKPIISSPYRSKRTGALVITFTVPFLSPEGKFTGLLAGSVDLLRNNFAGNLRNIQIGKTGKIVVSDSRGEILCCPDLNPVIADLRRTFSEVIKKGLPKENRGLISSQMAGGKPYVLAIQTIQATPWMVGVMMEEEEILAPLKDLRNRIFLFLFITLVVVMAIAFWGMRRLARPIKALSESISHYKGGDWEEPPGLIERRDEIGELGQSFKSMSDLLSRTVGSLTESEVKYRALVQESLVGVFLIQKGRFIFVNPRLAEIFGYQQEELLSTISPLDLVSPRDREHVRQVMITRVTEEERLIHFFWQGLHKDGSIIEIETMGTSLIYQGKMSIHGTLMDITERKQAEDALKTLSLRDELTGLYNRRGFFTLAEQGVKTAKRMGVKMLLIYGDMDNLKKINDTLGHQEGDRALIDLSQILKETFRESDIIARMGGDEFVILATNGSGDPAEKVISRFKKTLKDHPFSTNRSFPLSLSLGVICFDPENPCHIDELLSRADQMMYANKLEHKRVTGN
jgi:diguanylate cyclase (GGDEF)-like protein/PAS domain S-box-containing protein